MTDVHPTTLSLDHLDAGNVMETYFNVGKRGWDGGIFVLFS